MGGGPFQEASDDEAAAAGWSTNDTPTQIPPSATSTVDEGIVPSMEMPTDTLDTNATDDAHLTDLFPLQNFLDSAKTSAKAEAGQNNGHSPLIDTEHGIDARGPGDASPAAPDVKVRSNGTGSRVSEWMKKTSNIFNNPSNTTDAHETPPHVSEVVIDMVDARDDLDDTPQDSPMQASAHMPNEGASKANRNAMYSDSEDPFASDADDASVIDLTRENDAGATYRTSQPNSTPTVKQERQPDADRSDMQSGVGQPTSDAPGHADDSDEESLFIRAEDDRDYIPGSPEQSEDGRIPSIQRRKHYQKATVEDYDGDSSEENLPSLAEVIARARNKKRTNPSHRQSQGDSESTPERPPEHEPNTANDQRERDIRTRGLKQAEYDSLKKEVKALADRKAELLKRLLGGKFLSREEQANMSSDQELMLEKEARLKTLAASIKALSASINAQETPDTSASKNVIPSKGRRARNAREWFARDNETRKDVIERKRKFLHQAPVPHIAKPDKRKKGGSKYTDRMADGKEQVKKKSTLSLAKLQYTNPMQARMARRELHNPEDFEASKKGDQLDHHLANAPENSDEKTIKADKGKLDRAAKSFGLNNCKPVNNRWAIDGMQTPLFNHQVIGTSWMLEREFSQDKGGVMADEMGMGKTIQTLATIVSNPPTQQHIREGRITTLIVVPSSAVDQWMKEIRKHTDPARMRHIYHYKASKDEDMVSLRQKDVMVTTYFEVLKAYLPKDVRRRIEHKNCSEVERNVLRASHLGDLFKIPFHRVVLDEAHAIKDPNTQTSYACRNLDATYRWALSGTPLQNRSEEFWPYLAFLQVSWARTLKDFRQLLLNIENKVNRKQLDHMVDTVLLQRTMADSLLGKRIYSIPECHDEVRSFPLSKEEEVIYRVVEERYRKIINALLAKQKKSNHKVSLKDLDIYIVFLTRLRQATAHPFLLEPAFKNTVTLENLEQIGSGLKILGGKQSVIEQIRAWRFRHNIKDPMPSADGASSSSFGNSQFGTEFDMEHQIRMAVASKNPEACNFCLDTLSNPQIADCDHIFCKDCIDDAIMQASQNNSGGPFCPICDARLANLRQPGEAGSFGSAEDEIEDEFMSEQMKAFRRWQELDARAKAAHEQTILGKDGRKLGNDYFDIQPRLKAENTMFLRNSDKNYPVPMVPSAKTTVVKEIILQWQVEARDDKIIIFTQFLEESAIIGRMLQDEGLGFAYYFGGMCNKERNRALEAFHTNKHIGVLVASLKCGGVALNITCANRVIITDPWWNASIELQAYARVFRIGQEKECHFISLLAENTIDERIASLQAEKLNNIEATLKHHKKPTVEEMASLFGRLTEDEDGCPFIEPDYRD